jgi:hypothetical protein
MSSLRATAGRAMPPAVQQFGQRAYVQLGTMTAGLRLRPGFIMIGASRSGTTSLFHALSAHPQVHRPTFNKGVRYFDLNYYRGPRWYLGHFPLAGPARLATARHGAPVAFEASGYYFFHPFAIERMARDLPDVKLIAMLRDPAERAFSAYKHERSRGFEWEPFERALELEDDRLLGEADRMRADPRYESFTHRHHSYKHRGHYADLLEGIYQHFPREQVHIVDSGDFFERPRATYDKLLSFLQLRPFPGASFKRLNAEPGSMSPQTRRQLEEYFAPHDKQLADLLGWTPSWVR